jgi:hypothetical protein
LTSQAESSQSASTFLTPATQVAIPANPRDLAQEAYAKTHDAYARTLGSLTYAKDGACGVGISSQNPSRSKSYDSLRGKTSKVIMKKKEKANASKANLSSSSSPSTGGYAVGVAGRLVKLPKEITIVIHPNSDLDNGKKRFPKWGAINVEYQRLSSRGMVQDIIFEEHSEEYAARKIAAVFFPSLITEAEILSGGLGLLKVEGYVLKPKPDVPINATMIAQFVPTPRKPITNMYRKGKESLSWYDILMMPQRDCIVFHLSFFIFNNV